MVNGDGGWEWRMVDGNKDADEDRDADVCADTDADVGALWRKIPS